METMDKRLKRIESKLSYLAGPAVDVNDLQLLLQLARNTVEMEKSLNRSIRHATERVSIVQESHGDNPVKTHNYYGGQALGYWEGRLSAFNDLKDKIEELEGKEK